MSEQRPVIVGITGASGSVLAAATIELVLRRGVPVISVASAAARMVWAQEMEESFGEAIERWTDMGDFTHLAIGDMRAGIASGTIPVAGMAVVPCSMATASAIAHGSSDNLLRRAADVTIKEGRPLVVVPRETPMSVIHLGNLATLAGAGAVVIPPEPAFYLGQESIAQVVDFVAHRTALALGVIEDLPDRMRYAAPDSGGNGAGSAGSAGSRGGTRG